MVFQTCLPATPSGWAKNNSKWSLEIEKSLHGLGIANLFQHQAQAIDLIRRGEHVIVATPTASGKSLIYNLPVLERIRNNPRSKNLYLFPLKALAQDQLQAFEQIAAYFDDPKPTAAIYDGDTSPYRRKRIREMPPNVIMTNPEMLHLSFLAHHRKWEAFFRGLQTVVIDEVHTYRGILGSHVSQIFRRFHRICYHYGVSPTFVFSSATVANPARLARQLTAHSATAVTKSSAPQGNRYLVFFNPEHSLIQATLLLLKEALNKELRTIVYTQSRKLAELIALWAGNQSKNVADRISAYRAGFLPEERRDIEARLSSGDLLVVISTSALELGIDIGDLDLCILVGYPGTMVSTWQRSGRVGRSGQDSALILIAGEDSLDQFFMRNPQDFLSREPEAAVVNPNNTQVMAKHLECAAAELSLKSNETMTREADEIGVVQRLVKKGKLLRSQDGKELFARRKNPHRFVDIRGAGNRFQIIEKSSGKSRGEIDEFRAFRETHVGAIYLHRGKSYVVDGLDLTTRTISISRADVDYYTQVRGFKETELLQVYEKKQVWGTTAYLGRLKVTDQVTEYEIRRISTKNMIRKVSLDLPPQIFETEGLWFKISQEICHTVESKDYDFMGGIHALEHAAIGIFPLLVMADRNDLGGLSTLYHPQLSSAAVFIFDGIPGGAGLNQEAFNYLESLLEYTRSVIRGCPCASGCPSCVHSPKCGSGNRPMDKAAAIFILDRLKHGAEQIAVKRTLLYNQKDPNQQIRKNSTTNLSYGVFDLETQKSAAEVGGWHRADQMKISCAVLYDSIENRYIDYMENQIPQLIERLQTFDRIIGFNIKRFDFQVLKGYTDFNFQKLNNLDILEEVNNYLGHRLSLAHLASVSLGEGKTADGLQALQWWKQGRILEIIAYCRNDVKITRDLYRFGRKNRYLLFKNKDDKIARIPVSW